jgi:DNA-directed RNA polymerase specialized sigma24 family protein
MTASPERRHQLHAFYTAHADRLRRTVASRARGDDENIDDACATAWTALVRRSDISLDSRGLSWLTTVAIREAWQLHASRRHETAVGGFQASPHGHDDSDVPEPNDPLALDTETQALDRIQHTADVATFNTLKPRERQALYLKGLGYHYHEICDLSRGVSVYGAVMLRSDVGDMSLMEASRHRGHRSSCDPRPRDAPWLLLLPQCGGAVTRSRGHSGAAAVRRYQWSS